MDAVSIGKRIVSGFKFDPSLIRVRPPPRRQTHVRNVRSVLLARAPGGLGTTFKTNPSKWILVYFRKESSSPDTDRNPRALFDTGAASK